MQFKKIIKTERLKLRLVSLLDAINVQRLAGDFEITDTTLFIPYPYKNGIAEE